MIIIKNKQAIDLMREGGRIGANVLEELASMLKPGITTESLDKKAENLLLKQKARPAFKGFAPFDKKKYPKFIP